MNSSIGFRFRRVALAAILPGFFVAACLNGGSKPLNTATCTLTSDCPTASECSAGVCVPSTQTGGTGNGNGGGAGGNAGSVDMSGGGAVSLGGSAGTAAGGVTQTGPITDLVDDLEDNDAKVMQAQGRQGSWYTFTDGSTTPGVPDNNANSNGFLPGSPGSSKSSAHAAHVVASNFPNFAGLAVDFNNSGVRPKDTANRKVYDVSGYDGIVFQAKGTSSGAMRVMAVTKQIAGTAEGGTCDDTNTANHCWESYGKDFTLAGDWAEVKVRFSEMTTGNSSPFDPKSVFGLAFQDNAANGSLDLWVDDLALFKDATSGGGAGGSGNAGSGSGGAMSTGGATSCALPGSANPGSGSFTWYYFGQGTAQQNGMYKTGCGYTGTESGMTDTVSNIAAPSYFAAIPGKNGFDTVGHCGECVKITNGGNSIVATVIDECPTDNGQNPACTPEHLDLSWKAWSDLGYSVGNPSGTTWQFVPCQVTGNVQISFNGPNELYVQNMVVPIQSVTMNGANGNHTSYGSWQFGGAVQGQSITITDVAGRVITVTANGGNTGKQFPSCN